MESLLLLCHRLPWPPDKGDKIRSYHVLRRLAEGYRIYLGAFIDDPSDWQYVEAVKACCADVCIRPLARGRKLLRAAACFVRGQSLTVGVYRDRLLCEWVDRLIDKHAVDLVLCYSSGTAPLVMRHRRVPRFMDFVDADSDKWHQYARDAHGPQRMLYRREARKLAAFERYVAGEFDAAVFVSEAEARFFRSLVPESAAKIHGIPNGVDASYWDPAREYSNPYPLDKRVAVFVGAMDYRANVDAVRWFATEVWPKVRVQQSAARFYVVGSHPTREVRALAAREGVRVTGRVDDVRPYLSHAHVVVAPLRVARGIQNKVLEALTMEKVVLATRAAWEGIDYIDDFQGCISDAPETLAAETLRWLSLARPERVPDARAYVTARYDWYRNLDAYERILHPPQHQTGPKGVGRPRVHVQAIP